MYREILHIGANKTGSTTLQRCLFPNLDEIVYLGEDCSNYEELRKICDQMVSEDDFYYDSASVNKMFEKYKTKAIQEQKPFLYSNEDIMTSRVPSVIAKRMKALLPNAKVVLVIRNQLSAVPSWYSNHGAFLKGVPRRYWRSYVSFSEFMTHFTAFYHYSPLASFQYHKLISYYSELFGKENIQILFYEDFIKDKEKFLSQFAEILGVDKDKAIKLVENKRERERLTMKRFRVHQFKGLFFPWSFYIEKNVPVPKFISKTWSKLIDNGKKADGFLNDYWSNKIIEIYKEDNRKLAEDFNLDLKKYNYPL